MRVYEVPVLVYGVLLTEASETVTVVGPVPPAVMLTEPVASAESALLPVILNAVLEVVPPMLPLAA